jgi:uncharacterized cupredoxin-like copper-binding protein
MTAPTDADARRELRLAALVMGGLAAGFTVIAGVSVAVAMPESDGPAARVVAAVAADPAPATTAPATTAPAATAAPTVADPSAPLVVSVTLGELFFAPKALEVPAGRPIRFEVTNPGALPHELLIGDRHAQDEAEKQMAKGGAAASHSHGDEAPSLYLEAGQRGTLEVTFDEPGELLIGCHVPGHWAAGMRGTLSVSR